MKDNGDNVITDVAFALELLIITFHIWKEGGDVKHDLVALVLFKQGEGTCVPVADI